MDFGDASLAEEELSGIAHAQVASRLRDLGARHHGETWSPDLRHDEYELEGETFWLIDETHVGLSIRGRPGFVEALARRILGPPSGR